MAITGFLVAVLLSLAVCGMVYLSSDRLGVLDRPDDDLKTHDRPVALLGGAGVLVGVHVGLVVVGNFDPALLVATLIAWLIGVVDDVRGLSPIVRLVGAILAGFALAAMSDLPPGDLVFVFWVVATVVVVNAVNLLDGMDGLVGTVSIVALIGLWIFSVSQGAAGPHIYVVSIGAILGFVFWNLPPARMFLGDNGAYVIAVILSWAALRASPDAAASLVGLAIVGVPLLDLAVTVGRRLGSGRPLFAGDRDHTYDRMRAGGHSVGLVLAAFVLAQALWVAAVITPALVIGDLAAAVLAVLLGAVVVSWAVLRSRAVPPV